MSPGRSERRAARAKTGQSTSRAALVLRRQRVLVLVAGGAITVGGCAGKALDTARGEREIVRLVLRATGHEASVACPRDVPLRKDQRTVCALRGRDGSQASATIVQTDNKGNVRVSSELMHTALVENRIARDASAKLGFGVSVTCPDLVEIATGSHVRCTATDRKGRSAPVLVEITDANGSFTYRLAAEAGLPPKPVPGYGRRVGLRAASGGEPVAPTEPPKGRARTLDANPSTSPHQGRGTTKAEVRQT